MEDLTREFIAESQECLDRMERCLTTLEVRPNDPELVAEIFRAVHTIKGTTGFLGFGRLEALAHAGETLLGKLRDGLLQVSGDLISGLLDLLDGLRRIVALIDETGGEGRRRDDEDAVLLASMARLATPENVGPRLRLSESRRLAIEAADRADETLDVERLQEDAGPVHAKDGDGADGVAFVAPEGAGGNDRTLRVDVDVLNRMMELVGELVLTRNQILQSSLDSQGFAQLGRRLDAVTTDLRETVMQARMQPVGNVFSKFPRLVRDLAKVCGKRVRVEFAGQETGLDKSLLEAIRDPLTHAVRNAVGHGLETSEARTLAGKSVEGVLRLRAFHQGGAVVIEVTDDGAGISVEKVRAKAVERGLVTAERADAMSDADAVQMVFLAGFSTAETVTNLSGRGVGMDVVRANVEKVGGSVELESRAGRGTTLRLRVPLTLAILHALVVVSAGETFAIPQSALLELIHVGLEEAGTALERIGEAEVYRLRGRLLPTLRLDELLGLRSRGLIGSPVVGAGEMVGGEESKGFYLAVLEADGCRFGLILDDLLAPEEIVVKPLSLALREIGIFSGATVLGNGSLTLILDVPTLAARAGVHGTLGAIVEDYAGPLASKDEAQEQRFLMFEGGPAVHGERMAIPLDRVERIESILVDEVEYAGQRALLQHRGNALLLRDLGGCLQAGGGTDRTITVLICTYGPGRVGLVVARVFHVATGRLLSPAEAMPGGLALIEGKLTMVQDLDLLEQAARCPVEALEAVA